MMKKWISGLLGVALVWGTLAGVVVSAQSGPYSSQIQAALRSFVNSAHSWAGDQTFTGRILLADGLGAAPSMAFASDPDTGWFWVGANTFAAVAGTAQQLQIENGAVRLGGATLFSWGTNLILSRESAAVLQIGADAAGVTDQMLKGPDRITSAGVGGNLTIAGGRGFDTGLGGSVIIQTAPAAGAGVAGILGTVMSLSSTALTLTTIVAPSASGVRFLCISTTGVVTSQAAACVGT